MFHADPDERFYGLGQHQHGLLDQKGAVVELVQRNTEVSVPFALTSRGYGFLWNMPGVGRVELATNGTRWVARAARQVDYWVTTGPTPGDVVSQYARVTGLPPMLPEWASGFWQSKLRYRSQQELLEVAFVSTMISTGQVVPISGLSGFSTTGYYPAVIDEGLSGGKYYSLPVAGANSIALIYNIAMFKAANLTPPKTWADLVSDAKALTTSAHYGIALTCEAAEDTTWQWEPFFWSDGGTATFSNVSGTPGMRALTLWSQLVSDGSASKSCLNWSQTPAASTQFIDGKAAMMVNGPWNFPTMNQANLFYGKQFGVVPVPTQVAGQHVIVPLGGEDWMVSKSGGSAAQQLAFDYIQGMQTPTMELQLAKLFGYLPAKISVAKTYVAQAGPEWSVYVNQTLFAHPRTLGLGVKYPKISQAVWTAIQAALSGSQSVQGALNTAQSQINTILQG